MATLAELKEEVRQTKEVAAAAATLIRGLAAKIEELKNDPVALQEMVDDLNSAQDEIGAAVASTEPAPEPPTPVDPPADPPTE